MMLFVSTSWGNDSVALVQWLHEHGVLRQFGRVICLYADTGWSASDWPARVARGEALARSYGFEAVRIESIGFVPLARLRKGFPRNGMQFCTSELKIKPLTAYLDQEDPERTGTIALGVRREESRARASWPEYIDDSPKHGGRSAWSPLVRVTTAERDTLLARAGFAPLPHRSKECFPSCCQHAN